MYTQICPKGLILILKEVLRLPDLLWLQRHYSGISSNILNISKGPQFC